MLNNICGEYFNKRPFELDKDEYRLWMEKAFKTFDTIDTTLQLKDQIHSKVRLVMDANQKHTGNEIDDEKEITLSIMDNLIDRRSDINKVYKSFFLRYLSPKMRELIWKGLLLDQQEVKTYEDNIKYDKSFTISKDEIYMLKIIQSLTKDKFHSFGNDYDIIILIKSIMIYSAAYLNTYLQDFHYYMLFPLIHVFKSYRTYTRAKMLVSFYISTLRVRQQIVDEVNEKDEHAYEGYINYIIESLLGFCEIIDPALKQRMDELLAIEDSEIKTFHMDLLASVRGQNHLSNLDLRISKQKVIFGELLRSFLERCSVGFVNVRTSCVIWDFILIKNNKSKDDLFIAFALILNMIKQDVFDSANIIHLERVLREKALLIDDYDFFCVLFEYGKEKDWKPSFTLLNGDSLRQNFVSLDRIKQDLEYDNKMRFDQNAQMNQRQQEEFANKFEEAKQFNNPMSSSGLINSQIPSQQRPDTNQTHGDMKKPILNPSAMQPNPGKYASVAPSLINANILQPAAGNDTQVKSAQNQNAPLNPNPENTGENHNWYKPNFGPKKT